MMSRSCALRKELFVSHFLELSRVLDQRKTQHQAMCTCKDQLTSRHEKPNDGTPSSMTAIHEAFHLVDDDTALYEAKEFTLSVGKYDAADRSVEWGADQKHWHDASSGVRYSVDQFILLRRQHELEEVRVNDESIRVTAVKLPRSNLGLFSSGDDHHKKTTQMVAGKRKPMRRESLQEARAKASYLIVMSITKQARDP
nr:hypothetical protein BaRGS_031205 [Batillaria attramentaria]